MKHASSDSCLSVYSFYSDQLLCVTRSSHCTTYCGIFYTLCHSFYCYLHHIFVIPSSSASYQINHSKDLRWFVRQDVYETLVNVLSHPVGVIFRGHLMLQVRGTLFSRDIESSFAYSENRVVSRIYQSLFQSKNRNVNQ